MTFFSMLNGAFTVPQQLELLLRLVVASLCGAAIGFERTRRLKEAGLRTHCVVACASALLMIVSKYCFADLAVGETAELLGSRGADPSRIAAQIVSGIGFLGAGMIFRNGMTVRGLTTAAGVWATAAVGMAVGSGLYFIGLFAALLIVVTQMVLHRLNVGADAYSSQKLSIAFYQSDAVREALERMFSDLEAQILESSIERDEDGLMTYRLVIRSKRPVTFEMASGFLREFPEVRRFSN